MAASDPPLAVTLTELASILREDGLYDDAAFVLSLGEEADPVALREGLTGDRFWGGEGSVLSRDPEGRQTRYNELLILVGGALEDFGWETPRTLQASLLLEDWLHRPSP